MNDIIPTDLPAPHYLNTAFKYVRVKYYENEKGTIFVPPHLQNPCHFPDLSFFGHRMEEFSRGMRFKEQNKGSVDN